MITLVIPGRTPEEAANIWLAWEPHIWPPPTHSLIAGTQARDTILIVLCVEYNTAENAEGNCLAFLDFVVAYILQETLTAHTVVTLTEEAIAVGLLPSAYLSSLCITMRLLITGALATMLFLI